MADYLTVTNLARVGRELKDRALKLLPDTASITNRLTPQVVTDFYSAKETMETGRSLALAGTNNFPQRLINPIAPVNSTTSILPAWIRRLFTTENLISNSVLVSTNQIK